MTSPTRKLTALFGLVISIMLVVLTGCAAPATTPGTTTIRLAVTDLQGLEELQREFGEFVKKFEEKSGYKLELYPVTDRTAAAAALQSDHVDLVFTGPAEYVVLNARTSATPVISIRRPDYHSCIYTTKSSGITDLQGLKGKQIAMSDIGSTSGHLGPSQLLVDAGLNPQKDLKVLTVGDAVHEALVRGDVQAVGIGCHDYEEFMDAETDPSKFVMLKEGEPLPPDVIMARQGLAQDVRDKVKQTFEDNWAELLKAMLAGKDNAKYQNATLVETSDSDYNRVRDMYRAIGVTDFSNAPE